MEKYVITFDICFSTTMIDDLIRKNGIIPEYHLINGQL